MNKDPSKCSHCGVEGQLEKQVSAPNVSKGSKDMGDVLYNGFIGSLDYEGFMPVEVTREVRQDLDCGAQIVSRSVRCRENHRPIGEISQVEVSLG